MTYTQNKSKKILKNKNICTIYFLFRQLSLSLLQFPIWTMSLQTIRQFFFFLLFRQCYCHKFFFLSISAMPQTNCNNFFFPPILAMPLPHFFFFFWRNDLCTSFFQQILNDKLLLVVIIGLKK